MFSRYQEINSSLWLIGDFSSPLCIKKCDFVVKNCKKTISPNIPVLVKNYIHIVGLKTHQT